MHSAGSAPRSASSAGVLSLHQSSDGFNSADPESGLDMRAHLKAGLGVHRHRLVAASPAYSGLGHVSRCLLYVCLLSGAAKLYAG